MLTGENHGENRGRIVPRFWPLGILLLGENLGEFQGRIPARFWPPRISLPGENLAGISARFPPGKKILAAKILPVPGGIQPRSRSLFYKGATSIYIIRHRVMYDFTVVLFVHFNTNSSVTRFIQIRYLLHANTLLITLTEEHHFC